MSFIIADRVRESSSTIGTGTMALTGNMDNYQSFASAVGNGNTCRYCIVNTNSDDQWEVGLGTVQISGITTFLERTAIEDSSNNGSVVSLSPGNKLVTLVFSAEQLTSISGVDTSIQAQIASVDSRITSVEAVYDAAFTSVNAVVSAQASLIVVITSAVASVDARVTSVANTTSVNGAAIASVDSRVTSVNTQLGVVSAALTSVDSRVTSVNSSLIVRIDAVSANVTSVDSRVTSVNNLFVLASAAITSINNVTTSINQVVSVHGAAITSINTALNARIDVVSANVTSVDSRVTSVNNLFVLASAALTSINAAVPRLAAANTFTSINVFQVSTYVSGLEARGPVYAGFAIQLTDATSIAVNMALGIDFQVTLGGNRTLEAPTNLQPNQSGFIIIAQDGTGSRTLAYNSVWKFPGGTAPTLTTTSSRVDVLSYNVRTSSIIFAQMGLDYR